MPRIRGFGAYLPARVVDNAEIARLCGADPEWITQQTGIERRRWAAPTERVADLGVFAARDCLASCGVLASEIGMVLVSSGSAERRFPGPAAPIAAALGLEGKPAIDLPLASAGTLFGLSLAADLARHHGNILVIGTEILSRVIGLNPAYRDTAILFGDGAGACVVSEDQGFAKIRDSVLCSDGDFAEILRLDVDAPLHMDGRTVIMQVARKLPRAIRELLDRNHVPPTEVEAYLLHQANLNLITRVASNLGAEDARFFRNLKDYGNTSSASLLIAATEWWKQKGEMKGPVVMAAFGAGLNWGAILLDPA
ncbi:MAG TPA: ketoacyl-ACP synthase III [Bryobacteraceae bacterium]|jgi:3-oxoacyl-[acyl-carrier-protein] synthase-3